MAKKTSKRSKEKVKEIDLKALVPGRLRGGGLLWVLLSSSVLGFIVFFPYLFGGDYFIFKDIGSDTYNTEYPNLVHVDRYLSEYGYPITWSFYIGMGQNIYTGWYFGIQFLLDRLIDLFTSDTAYRIGWIAWAETVLIAIFSYLWFRVRQAKEAIAVFAGLALAFSGYSIVGGSWYYHNTFILNSVFVLYGLDMLWTQKRLWILPLALYSFHVDPKLFFFFQFAILYYVIRGAELQWNLGQWLKNGAIAAGLGVLGFLGNGSSIVSRIVRVLDSPRVSTAASLSDDLSKGPVFAVHDSGHLLTTWLRTISNDLLGAGSDFSGWNNYLEAPTFYCSLLALLLVPQLFLLGSVKVKRLWGVVLGLAMIPLFFPFFRHAIYMFQGDYYKKGLNLFIPLLIVLMAVEALKAINREKKVHVAGLIITAFILLMSTFYPYYDGRLILVKPIQQTIAFSLMGLAIALLWFQFNKKSYGPLVLLFLCLLLDLGVQSAYGFRQREVLDEREMSMRIGYNDFSIEALNFIKSQDSGFYRVEKLYASGSAEHRSLNEGRIMGYFGTSQYSSFNQSNYIRFMTHMGLIDSTRETQTRWSRGVTATPLLYPFTQCDYVLSKSALDNPVLRGMYDLIHTIEDIRIYKLSSPLPVARFYDQAASEAELESGSPTQRIIHLYDYLALADKDLESDAVVKDSLEDLNMSEYTLSQFNESLVRGTNRGSFELKTWSQTHFEGVLNTNKSGWLFYPIPYDEGWKAMINGQEEDVLRAQFGFLAVPVQAGASSVELYFRPVFSNWGNIISLSALFLWFGLFVIDIRRFRFNESD